MKQSLSQCASITDNKNSTITEVQLENFQLRNTVGPRRLQVFSFTSIIFCKYIENSSNHTKSKQDHLQIEMSKLTNNLKWTLKNTQKA